MTNMVPPVGTPKRIGFISTRFHGTDGVTLEARKWAQILEGMGHTCYWMAGQLDAPVERSYLAPLAFFNHPEVATLQSQLFGVPFRTRAITNQIQKLKERLKDDLYHFIRKFNLEVLVPENILAIPMHVPLGLAMTEVIAETPIPVIAHHHDFAWERERFTLNGVNDCLAAAFQPAFFAMDHVVINSMAQKELARRLGIPSHIIPNILQFETTPPGLDDYNSDLRREIGLRDDD
ncbi:MAG TPA: glycosyltransferase family 1 protein, partial [Verrucomicrobiota bacterium]|nr:glycosyltransferase family 1 protein [Verrucomicrobiota bacterium]